MKYFFKISVCLIIIVLGKSCYSKKLIQTTALPAERYKYYKIQQGLKIAIDPYFQADKVENTFGTNMLNDGYLPIFVVLENHNADTSFYIKKDAISFSELTLGELEKLKDENIKIENIIADISRQIYPIGRNFSLAVWGTYLIAKELSNIQKTEVIRHNVVKQTLMEKTVNPGGSNSGFIYVNIKDNSTRNFLLTIKASDFKSKKDINFYFVISR
jgi:hypothetical protein